MDSMSKWRQFKLAPGITGNFILVFMCISTDSISKNSYQEYYFVFNAWEYIW